MMTRCSRPSSAAPNWAPCRWSMPKTAMLSPRCRQKLLAEGNNGPEGHAYSRPPEVEGEATNRAIMIADMAGVPLYVVHTSCEQAHEAIRRARQKGMRVYGEPLIQHLTLDESEYFQQGLGPFGAPGHEPALPQQGASGFAVGRACRRGRCRSWPPTTAPSPPSRSAPASAISPRSRTAPAGWKTACRCCGPWRQYRPADDERVRRRHLDQHRQDPQHLPKKGAIVEGADADIVVWDPEKEKTISAGTPAIGDRLQCLRGQASQGPAALRADPRRQVVHG